MGWSVAVAVGVVVLGLLLLVLLLRRPLRTLVESASELELTARRVRIKRERFEQAAEQLKEEAAPVLAALPTEATQNAVQEEDPVKDRTAAPQRPAHLLYYAEFRSYIHGLLEVDPRVAMLEASSV